MVWAFLGYRLSENDRKMLGRTPWGLPSMLWAFFWFLSLILGLVLYLIAHSVGDPAGSGASAGHRRQRNTVRTADEPSGCLQTCAFRVRAISGLSKARQLAAGADRGHARGRGRGLVIPERRHNVADRGTALTAGLASRSERPIPLSMVGRDPVDLAGLDGRTPPHRHQSGPEGRAVRVARVPVPTRAVRRHPCRGQPSGEPASGRPRPADGEADG